MGGRGSSPRGPPDPLVRGPGSPNPAHLVKGEYSEHFIHMRSCNQRNVCPAVSGPLACPPPAPSDWPQRGIREVPEVPLWGTEQSGGAGPTRGAPAALSLTGLRPDPGLAPPHPHLWRPDQRGGSPHLHPAGRGASGPRAPQPPVQGGADPAWTPPAGCAGATLLPGVPDKTQAALSNMSFSETTGTFLE